jgi:ParB family transcriptional regulator, chromosome partitioning protein
VDEVKLMPVDLIDPPVEMIRERIDSDAVRELAESIRSQGLMQPILVRPVDGRCEVVAGHRRLLAHRLIGEIMIKCFVRDLDDTETMLLRATENIQRQDLSPMEEARVYGVLRDKLGFSKEDIARKMGRNRLTVDKYLKMLDFPEYIQVYVDKKLLSMAVAVLLVEIDDPELQRYYVENAVDNGITSRTAEIWVADYNLSRKAKYYTERGLEISEEPKFEPSPIYMTCFLCHGAEDVRNSSVVQVCKECYNQVVLSRMKGSSSR